MYFSGNSGAYTVMQSLSQFQARELDFCNHHQSFIEYTPGFVIQREVVLITQGQDSEGATGVRCEKQL